MNDKIKADGLERSETNPMNFPSNSKTNKEEVATRKVQKVITGKAIQRKKPLGKKVAEIFMGEGNDVQSVTEYVVKDILIPSAKSMFLDTISTLGDMIRVSVEMSLFGTTSPRNRNTGRNRSTGSSGKTYVSYDKYSSNDRERRPSTDHNRSNNSFDGIVLANRGEADAVVQSLIDLTLDYGVASVADLYDLVGITGEFTDHKYGWTDLNAQNASYRRVSDGYILKLPRTKPIN